ncbi:hypothetical protein GCM10009789_37090 [Kribbella sancticallisti]|uniref:Tn3 transposase DDE domain-containing protein n=1 Tax=Kribbella sancticallisti TaxID=460087 RepID=A0ABP4PGC0_9ACTN
MLIYWHVEQKSMAIHSQVINCSASEVAAMIEGAMRHRTSMEVEGNYVDSHGQSEVGFGLTRLLGFDLLPRITRINMVRLYRPAAGEPETYPRLAPALTRPIRWDVIGEQYDQMIKYATAIRSGTASTEAILRRFTKANAIHPTYQAMIELGRAQKTLFVARYLLDRDLQREINEGLNVVESWNGGNSVIFFRQGRRHRLQPARRTGTVGAVPPGAAVGAGVREHADGPRRPGRRRVGRPYDRCGSPRSDTLLLDARRPVRRGAAEHGSATQPARRGVSFSRFESGRRGASRVSVVFWSGSCMTTQARGEVVVGDLLRLMQGRAENVGWPRLGADLDPQRLATRSARLDL